MSDLNGISEKQDSADENQDKPEGSENNDLAEDLKLIEQTDAPKNMDSIVIKNSSNGATK